MAYFYELRMDDEKHPTLARGQQVWDERITSVADTVTYLRGRLELQNFAEEHMYLLSLTTRGDITGVFEISMGSASESVANIRGIFIRLLLSGAVSFIVAHNHPSGDTHPSKEDISTTEKLSTLSSLMDIKLLDHIIVGEDYFSFKEEGYLL